MLRFRNPGTQYSTQIQVIKELYNTLGSQPFFTLEDMAIVIAHGKLMTAYGYAGSDALRLSNTEKESMNSTQMNVKMYAEVFRMLGWVTPYGKKSYPLVFTYIGIHVALSKGDCSKLYEQCVLGVNNPTELAERMSYDEEVRFFKCALRSFIDLGGVMYKHELSLGPMSVNDRDEKAYQEMIQKISEIRGNHKNLKTAFLNLANSLGMKLVPVDNCTRLPVALMKSCNFVEEYTTSDLYNKSMICLKITQHGTDTYNLIREMKDLRLDEFNSYEKNTQMALIRLGIYSMLERSGYILDEVKSIVQADKEMCYEILEGKELLFSPYQTIKRDLIEEALGIKENKVSTPQKRIITFESTVNKRKGFSIEQTWVLNVSKEVARDLLTEPEDIEFINEVNRLKFLGNIDKEIVDILFNSNVTATQTTFYPLIATLFKIMGFNCSFSRAGDNGARWDAIIEDPTRSIPIEIKSPTEEQYLSIKAIRQALENKIILLSRKTHITTPEVTTLAVGYYLPNDRAEVTRLIVDFKDTYGYKIGFWCKNVFCVI